MLALVLVAIDLFKQQHVGFCGVLMSKIQHVPLAQMPMLPCIFYYASWLNVLSY